MPENEQQQEAPLEPAALQLGAVQIEQELNKQSSPSPGIYWTFCVLSILQLIVAAVLFIYWIQLMQWPRNQFEGNPIGYRAEVGPWMGHTMSYTAGAVLPYVFYTFTTVLSIYVVIGWANTKQMPAALVLQVWAHVRASHGQSTSLYLKYRVHNVHLSWLPEAVKSVRSLKFWATVVPKFSCSSKTRSILCLVIRDSNSSPA